MTSPISTVSFIVVLAATMVCLTDWLFRSVLTLRSPRPMRAAAATLALSSLTVGPSVFGVDALLGGDLASLTRGLLALLVGVVQTGLVVRLVFDASLPTALAHGLILQLAWGAMSVLVLLFDRLGGHYYAVPLVAFVAVHAVGRARDRDLVRRLSSVPPTAPNADLRANPA